MGFISSPRLLTDGAVAQSTNYTYNAANNHTQMVSNGVTTTYDYNNLDQLTQMIADGVTTDYTYDNRGNLLTETTNNVVTDYTWDARDRLIEVDKPGTLVSYVYNYQGNRVQQTFNTEVTKFVWDTLSRYGDVVAETDENSTLTTAYTLAMGHVLAQHSSADHYLLEDAQSSTRFLTDTSANIVENYDYDAYGQLINNVNTPLTSYLYTGQQYDSETDLYSLRARYYDASVGRFLSQDKYPVDVVNPVEYNRYAYTANNPANRSDPSGFTFITRSLIHEKLTSKNVRTVLLLGAAVGCAYSRMVSYLMAMNKDGLGLRLIELMMPSPDPCHIPIILYPYFETPDVAQHIIDAQQHHPMLLTYIGPKSNPVYKSMHEYNRDKACRYFRPKDPLRPKPLTESYPTNKAG